MSNVSFWFFDLTITLFTFYSFLRAQPDRVVWVKRWIECVQHLFPVATVRSILQQRLHQWDVETAEHYLQWVYYVYSSIYYAVHRTGPVEEYNVMQSSFQKIEFRNLWGPSFWKVIHLCALNGELGKHLVPLYRNFIIITKSVLPCPVCATHLNENLTQLPIDEVLHSTPLALFFWSFQLHNIVNAQTQKLTLRFEEVLAIYSPVLSTLRCDIMY